MTGGIQTLVLIVFLGNHSIAVGGYGSLAECEAAKQIARRELAGVVGVRAFCVPGPVEGR